MISFRYAMPNHAKWLRSLEITYTKHIGMVHGRGYVGRSIVQTVLNIRAINYLYLRCIDMDGRERANEHVYLLLTTLFIDIFRVFFVCLLRTGQNPLHRNYINASAFRYTFAFWFASSSTHCIPFATISNVKMCGFCVVCMFFSLSILLCDGRYYFSFGFVHTKNPNTHTNVLISITFCIQSLSESDFCCFCCCRWNNIRNMNERSVCVAFLCLFMRRPCACVHRN